MFNKILVPLDRSLLAECVLPHAVAMACALDAHVYLLHVLPAPGRHDSLRAVDPLEWRLLRAESESYLQSVADRLQASGVTAEAHVSDGDPAEEIVDFAHENEIDLVLIASHGRSGLTGWNVSSVVQKVILRASVSLMVVRAYEAVEADIAGLQYRKVLAPLDSSARAECVLPLAGILGRTGDTQILLAHVVQRPAMPRRTPPSREDTELADRIVERNREEAESYLEGIRSQLPSDAVDTRLLVGDQVARVLHDLGEQEQVDLVLLSAHGYSGYTRWPYGGTVASFVAYGTRPLLIFQDAPGEQTELTQAEAAVRSDETRWS